MAREDLKATGNEQESVEPITCKISQGKVDFHALRTTFSHTLPTPEPRFTH